MRKIKVGNAIYRRVVAQDPDPLFGGGDEETTETPPEEGADKGEKGSELAEELRDTPAAQWEKYEQPIMVNIRNRYGLGIGQVRLVNPRVKTRLTSPQYGFSIVGHVKFLPSTPPEVREEHGLPPYRFEAFVTPEGKLVSSIRITGSED